MVPSAAEIQILTAEKQKLLEGFEAEKERLLKEHQLEIDEKEQSIFEAQKAAQEATRTLRLAERDHREAKRSLELTGETIKEMMAQQEAWTTFLRQLDGELSRKLIFIRLLRLFPIPRSILTCFPRLRRWLPCLERESG